MDTWILVGRCALTLLYVGAGIMHFVKPAAYLPLMPPYIPMHKAAIAVSGVAEIALGAALWWPAYATLAAWGIIALLVAVSPVHIYMAQHPERFKQMSKLVIYLRLPLQLLLMYWAYLYTTALSVAQIP